MWEDSALSTEHNDCNKCNLCICVKYIIFTANLSIPTVVQYLIINRTGQCMVLFFHNIFILYRQGEFKELA
jgi:hypothetical protein